MCTYICMALQSILSLVYKQKSTSIDFEVDEFTGIFMDTSPVLL